MKRLTLLLAAVPLTLLLASCVDTTGLSSASSRPPRGNANASVVVAEYGDLQCPACRAAHQTLNLPLLSKYAQTVRFEFHQFPLRNIHRYALDLAEASECAADQNKFWEFVDLDYAKQDQLDGTSVQKWGTELKLDMDLFTRCTKSHIKRKEILAEYDAGVKLGVQGTPTYFVNGKQTESTIEALSAAIDAAQKNPGQRL